MCFDVRFVTLVRYKFCLTVEVENIRRHDSSIYNLLREKNLSKKKKVISSLQKLEKKSLMAFQIVRDGSIIHVSNCNDQLFLH